MLDVIREAISKAPTRLMVAVDNPRIDLGSFVDLVSTLKDFVVGFKLGTPFIISKGLKTVKNIIESTPGTYFIADLKLTDLAHIMEYVVEIIREAGFHGLVAGAFIGYEGALDKVSKKCESLGIELFLQVSFDHPSSHIIDSRYADIKMVIQKASPEGVVVPASKTSMIKDLRETFGSRFVLISPGIFVAGAEPGEGLCHGADVEVVGSRVVSAPSPRDALEAVIKSQNRYLSINREKCIKGW